MADTNAPTSSSRLERTLEWIAPSRGAPTAAWRQRILAAVLLGLVGFGLLAYIPSVWFAYRAGEMRVIVLDTIMFAIMLGILLLRRLPYVVRATALVLSPAVLGTFFLLGFGFVAAGFEWIMAFPILAAVLLGLRAGMVALGTTMLILIAIGVAIPSGVFPWASVMPPGLPSASVMWMVNSISVLMLTALTTLSVGVLFGGLGNEASARRVAEAEAARLARAVDQSDGIVALLDVDGGTRYANRSAHALLGADPSIPLHAIGETVRNGQPWAGQFDVLLPDGETLPVSGTISPVRDDTGAVRYLLATLRDVRRERALELRLQQGQKLEAIGTLAGGIAHDFNNLLQPIVLNTESALAALPAGSAAAPLLDDVRSAAASARALVRRILTFTRAMEHDRRPIELGAIVRETERMLRASLPASVSLVTRIDDELTVNAEPGEMQQILLNLVTNASHAMSNRGTVSVHVARERAGDSPEGAMAFSSDDFVASMTVTDTGAGMNAATLERAFEPFFTTKGPGRGNGLGLAMVHGTVTALGGIIVPHSAPGEGTAMRVLLPLATALDAPRTDDGPSASTLRDRRVMLVDDDAAVLLATTRLLNRLGCEVEAHVDPLHAATRLRGAELDIDCLLTDLTMPGMTGLELADLARAREPAIPVVLATGYLEHDEVTAQSGARIAHLLTKPFATSDLQRVLDAVFRT